MDSHGAERWISPWSRIAGRRHCRESDMGDAIKSTHPQPMKSRNPQIIWLSKMKWISEWNLYEIYLSWNLWMTSFCLCLNVSDIFFLSWNRLVKVSSNFHSARSSARRWLSRLNRVWTIGVDPWNVDTKIDFLPLEICWMLPDRIEKDY